VQRSGVYGVGPWGNMHRGAIRKKWLAIGIINNEKGYSM